jgi:predicted AlkP superfamily pyrophosphatase or phosphodiesterase
MATGTYPDVHGIVDNNFRDSEKGVYRMSSEADWIEAEPLWIAAERQGVRTATYFWVGSETDWRGQGTRYRIAPFDNDRGEAVKVDQILAWLDGGEPPALIMTYWSGVDSTAHDNGPEDESVHTALQAQDAELGRLMAGFDARGLWDRLTLIVVSDHGMAAQGRLLDPAEALEDAGISARVVGSTLAQVYLADPQQKDQAARILADLEQTTVYQPDDLPPQWRRTHATRSGDLFLLTEPPYVFASVNFAQELFARIAFPFGWRRGGHGYEPHLDDMAGIFFAIGRGVPGGRRLGRVHQIDVAPTVSALLGIDPPAQAEGRSVFLR